MEIKVLNIKETNEQYINATDLIRWLNEIEVDLYAQRQSQDTIATVILIKETVENLL